MPNGNYLDNGYIEEVKNAGSPPSEIKGLVDNKTFLNLFNEFVANQDDDKLEVYASALRSLIVEQKNPDVVWSEVKNNWAGTDTDLRELLEDEPLRAEMLNDAFDRLGDSYKDFVNVVSQIKTGSLDENLEIGELDEDEFENELDTLLSQVAVKLDEKTNDEIDKILDFLDFDDYTVNGDELETEIRELKEVDSNDTTAIKRIRSSSRIDPKDLQQLLKDLDDDTLIFDDDDFAVRVNELAEVVEDAPKQQLINLIDVNELEADEQDIDELFERLEEYIKADNKNLELKKLRNSVAISNEDLDKLIEELNCPVSQDYSDLVNEFIKELAEESPGGVLTKNSVMNFVPKDLINNDYEQVINDLISLQNDDKPSTRRRLSTMLPKDDLDHLLEQLLSADQHEEDEPVGGQNQPQAAPRPAAHKITADEWNLANVAKFNYSAIRDSKPNQVLNVTVCGDYVLIGDDWPLEYTNGFLKAFEGDKEYPAGQGLVEVGKAQVEKGSGLFNQGTVRISKVTSGRNRAGITATITANSKKKVVFID